MANVPNTTRFVGFSNRVNLRERKSNIANAESQAYTMQDIADTTRPYKVFTAIVSQSGGWDNVLINEGELTLGITYFIDDPGSGDWTNVGAPNNDAGTYFIATGTTPNSWGDGALTYNAGTPVAIILENTLGNVYFRYSETGEYQILSHEGEALFDDSKLYMSISSPRYSGTSDAFSKQIMDYTGPSKLWLFTFDSNNTNSNDLLSKNSLEIRVYN